MKLFQQRKFFKKGSSLKDACICGVADSVKDKEHNQQRHVQLYKPKQS